MTDPRQRVAKLQKAAEFSKDAFMMDVKRKANETLELCEIATAALDREAEARELLEPLVRTRRKHRKGRFLKLYDEWPAQYRITLTVTKAELEAVMTWLGGE